MSILGCDLAYCNPNTDYQGMADYGVRFAILKLVQGTLNKDVMFDTHKAGCESVSVPWDFYNFCDYRKPAAQNVDHMLEVANGNYGMGHICEDLEYYPPWGYPDGYHMLAWHLEYCRTLEQRTGMLCTLYTNRWLLTVMWAVANVSQKIEMARHDLWFATDDATPEPTVLPFIINQWDLNAYVPWCVQRVDKNDFIGTEAEFAAWKNMAPPPLTLEERVDILEREALIHNWNLHP
jgi:GH25 family lysozyme M1 (1,4-beta-N-acetylmuramidase)